MEERKSFEDLQLGEKKITRARTITEADIVLFAAFTGDWSPHHTDTEFTKKSPFGERIAHGMLVLSVASGLAPFNEIMPVIAFYGMDKVRFVAPVKIGDTIHVELEVTEKQEKDKNSGVITLKQLVKNQRDEDVVAATMKLLISRR